MDPTFVPAAKLSELPPGRMKGVEVNGTPVLIANVGGTVYAIKDQCIHQHVRLSDGSLRDCIVTCRKHAWAFDLRTGEYLVSPQLKVKRYDVEVEGDEIRVHVPYEGYVT